MPGPYNASGPDEVGAHPARLLARFPKARRPGVPRDSIIGSSFEDYLAEQETLEETRAITVKRVLAWQLEQAMEERQMSKSAMAQAMRTSRSQLDRILDPDNDHIRLDTLAAAANVMGLNLRIELVG